MDGNISPAAYRALNDSQMEFHPTKTNWAGRFYIEGKYGFFFHNTGL